MTAVASPPSLQPLQRLGWSSEDGQNETTSVNGEDVSHIFLPRKILQRSNSSSSISSDSSANTTISTNPSTGTDASEISAANLAGVGRGVRPPAPALEKEHWIGQRKTKSLWPTSKSEGAFGGPAVGAGRPIGFSSANGVPLNQPPSISPHENMQNAQQAGGGRVLPHTGGNEPQALLVLVPTNATFDRKSISVSLFPEVLRIGRQTNAKTIPTATNGYFDSKVLSRQHAEVWADRNGKIWIRDVKSSNGTFVNGQRLSPESRDSEPHELRENDSLELGIDIVSEDQKSIVHHKVSAKVEHAGFPNSSANVMDLTFGDLDPGASSGLLTSIPNSLGLRPRLGSQGSIGSNGSRFDTQSALRGSGAFGVQRHMNAFLSPVTVETVMRKINTELRQAKQQSQDLHKTSEFFSALLGTEPGEEPPKPPASILPQKAPPVLPPLTNGLIPPSKLDHLSPFSAPPAPPPQLPLPEKPDGPRSAHVESSGSLPFKRASLDLPLLPNGKQDGSNSSQIISLVETLHTTKRELDIQGSRVRELEELLKHERKAREVAEERARLLSSRNASSDANSITPFTPPEEETSEPVVNGHLGVERDISDTTSEAGTIIADVDSKQSLSSVDNSQTMAHDAEATMASLQERLDRMVHEMEEVRRQLDKQRNRADTAETERNNLVDMVQRIRQTEIATSSSPRKAKIIKSSQGSSRATDASSVSGTAGSDETQSDDDSDITGLTRQATDIIAANGKPPGPGTDSAKDKQIRELQESLATALARVRKEDHSIGQTAPYVSMISVVILGVGAMIYLNGWQKVDR